MSDGTLYHPRRRLNGLGCVAIALAVLVFTAPSLSQVEFSGSMENLNAATVLEIRRTGNWLVPRLEGEARLNKPPLTAWVTTLFVPPSLVERLNEPNPAERERAYRELAFRIRLAPLIETCLTILLVAAIAQIALGGSAPLIAAAAYATSVLVLKLGSAATTDVQMTLWIALAQLGIALALWRRRYWAGCTLAGIGTGLAIMSKGPVCLLFLFLPLIGMIVIRFFKPADPAGGHDRLRVRGLENAIAPCCWGTLIALAIGLPWFVCVYLRSPQVLGGWTTEVTRVGATENASSNPVFYLIALLFLTPWLPWAVVAMIAGAAELRGMLRGPGDSGIASATGDREQHVIAYRSSGESHRAPSGDAARDWPAHRAAPAVWLLLSAVLPLVVMSFFPDRKDRYALPAMIPLALLAAYGVAFVQRASTVSDRARGALLATHYLTLAAIAIALPIAGATVLKTIDPRVPWFSRSYALAGGAAMLAVLVIGIGGQIARHRSAVAMLAATSLMMLIAQAMILHGYRNSRAGRSEMKPLADAIRAEIPSAKTIINARRDRKRISVDLAIYLNQSTQRIANWQTLPRQNPPAVAVVPQQHGTPEPAVPPGWRVLAKVPRDKDWWWAMVQTPEK